MRIRLQHQGRHFTLDVQRDGTSYRVNDGSTDRHVQAEFLSDETLVIEVEEKRHRVAFARSDDTFLVAIDGATYTLTREQSGADGAPLATVASPEIVAPMPGKVIQVLVKAGDAIARGQTVIVLEAMKMENRLLAEASGIVEAIEVSSGDLVEGGQVLAVIKYDEASEASDAS